MAEPKHDHASAQQIPEARSLLCPFCASKIVGAGFSESGLHFNTCQQCHSVFRDDADVPTTFEYSEDYYGDSPKEKFWLKPVVWMLNSERRSRARYIAKNCPQAKAIADAGCGNGALLGEIHKKSKAALTGIEMDNVAARRAAAHGFIDVVTKPFLNAELSSAHFDVLLMIHSFEHMPQPAVVLDKAASLLQPGGLFYMAIPNIRSWQYRLFGKRWLHLDPEFHIHFVSPDALLKMAHERGLQHIRSRHFNPVQNIPGFILSALNLVTGRRDVLFDMLRHRKKLRNPLNVLLFFLLMLLSLALLPLALLEETISVLSRRGATVDYVFQLEPMQK